MIHARYGECGFVALICAVASFSSLAGAAPEDPPTSNAAHDDRSQRLSQAVTEAIDHVQHRRYESALSRFDEALTLTTEPEQVSTLEFNAGVCLFELGRFGEAERRFLVAASLNPAAEPLLHAGFAAARSGGTERAREHLANARRREMSNTERALSERLERELSDFERYAKQREFAELLRSAFETIDQHEPTVAMQILQKAAVLEPLATPEQRANYHYAWALAHHLIDDPEAALRHLNLAIENDPRDGEFPRYRGMIHEQLGRKREAVRDHQAALALGLLPELGRDSEAALVRMHPLKAPGWEGAAQLSLGYDSNATQSGSASARGIANQPESVESPLALLYVQLGYRFRLDAAGSGRPSMPPSWDLTPALALTNFSLSEESVRELSVSAAQASLRLRFAPSLSTFFGLTLGAGAAFTGVWPETPFTRDLSVGLHASHATSRRWTTEASLSGGTVMGVGDATALTGPRVAVQVGERFRGDTVGVNVSAGASYAGLGSESFAANASTLSRCAGPTAPPLCDQLSFRVPLAYVAPHISGGLDWVFGRSWVVQAQLAAEARFYVDESVLSTPNGDVPESRKRRRDFRPEALLRGNYVTGSMALFAEQGVLVSVSNLEPDLADPAHRFDYEDRNYVQFVSQLGVRGEL